MKDVELQTCEMCGGQYYENSDGSRAPYTQGPRPCSCSREKDLVDHEGEPLLTDR